MEQSYILLLHISKQKKRYIYYSSEIDTVCNKNSYQVDTAIVEQSNAIDCQRFFNKYEQFGSSLENPINPCFNSITHEFMNEVLLFSAAGETDAELKKYLSVSGSRDTILFNLHAIHNELGKNRNIIITQSFIGLAHYQYSRNFINYLHCNGYLFDTVSFWDNTRKRIEINISTDITFHFDTNKIQFNSGSGTFGTSSDNFKTIQVFLT